jgi:hypothetical protein
MKTSGRDAYVQDVRFLAWQVVAKRTVVPRGTRQAQRRSAALKDSSNLQFNARQSTRCAIRLLASRVGQRSKDVTTTRTVKLVRGVRRAGGPSYASTLRQARVLSIASPSAHGHQRALETRRQAQEDRQPITRRLSKRCSAVMTWACRTASAARVPPMPPCRRMRHRCRCSTASIPLIS